MSDLDNTNEKTCTSMEVVEYLDGLDYAASATATAAEGEGKEQQSTIHSPPTRTSSRDSVKTLSSTDDGQGAVEDSGVSNDVDVTSMPQLRRARDDAPTREPGAFYVSSPDRQQQQQQQQQQSNEVDLENPSINDNIEEGESSPAIVATLIPEVEEILEGRVHNNNNETTSNEEVKGPDQASNTNGLLRILIVAVSALTVALIAVIIVSVNIKGGYNNNNGGYNNNNSSTGSTVTQEPTPSPAGKSSTTNPTISYNNLRPNDREFSPYDFPTGNLHCGTMNLPIAQMDYRGFVNVTVTGKACQPWDDQYPHDHNRNEFWWPGRGLKGNYCRNPDGEGKAWCYTMDPNVRWEYCDIPECNYCGVDFDDAQTNCRSSCFESSDCPLSPSGVKQKCFPGTSCTRVPENTQNNLYCGETFQDATEWCRKPCPNGFDNECDPRETCYKDTACVGTASSDTNYCGTSFDDANTSCSIPCNVRGSDYECPIGQQCFANTKCTG